MELQGHHAYLTSIANQASEKKQKCIEKERKKWEIAQSAL